MLLQQRGLFVAEGSSDGPLAAIVEELFLSFGVQLLLARPDFTALKVPKDVRSRVEVGCRLVRPQPTLLVVHRDADRAGPAARVAEIRKAVDGSDVAGTVVVPVVPVRMTEAWLLLDEQAIRAVAGNPRGSNQLDLPSVAGVEAVADPRALLRSALLQAANVTGRRRERLAGRFSQNRRLKRPRFFAALIRVAALG